MAYSSGGLIQATDYNGFASSVNGLWGTGSGNSGYGQSSTVPTVTGGTDTVTATQWATLIARMQSMQQQLNELKSSKPVVVKTTKKAPAKTAKNKTSA